VYGLETDSVTKRSYWTRKLNILDSFTILFEGTLFSVFKINVEIYYSNITFSFYINNMYIVKQKLLMELIVLI